MRLIARTTVFAALVLAASAASAQSTAPESTPIALGFEGDVMVSTGGEFVQATPGQPVEPGHRVLVAEGASATLDYGSGCSKAMSSAGVYTITGDCQAAGTRSGMSQNAILASVAGGIAVIAAASGGGGGGSTPPVSR